MNGTSEHALKAARAIANYCTTRFPTDSPPHEMLDVPYFAEKVQQAIDAALAERDAQRPAKARKGAKP